MFLAFPRRGNPARNPIGIRVAIGIGVDGDADCDSGPEKIQAQSCSRTERGQRRHIALIPVFALLSAAVAVRAEPERLVAWDIETTGFSPTDARIVEIGAVKFSTNGVVDTRQWLINPGGPIPWYTRQVHGITDDMVADAPDFATIYPEFRHFIGDSPLMAHNARFDMRFIESEAVRNGFDIPANAVLDTLTLARKTYPDAESYDMEGLTGFLKLPTGAFHHGLADAEHVMHLFLRILKDAPQDLDGYMAIGGLNFKTPLPEEK